MKRFCSDFSVINIHFQTIFSNKTFSNDYIFVGLPPTVICRLTWSHDAMVMRSSCIFNPNCIKFPCLIILANQIFDQMLKIRSKKSLLCLQKQSPGGVL